MHILSIAYTSHRDPLKGSDPIMHCHIFHFSLGIKRLATQNFPKRVDLRYENINCTIIGQSCY